MHVRLPHPVAVIASLCALALAGCGSDRDGDGESGTGIAGAAGAEAGTSGGAAAGASGAGGAAGATAEGGRAGAETSPAGRGGRSGASGMASNAGGAGARASAGGAGAGGTRASAGAGGVSGNAAAGSGGGAGNANAAGAGGSSALDVACSPRIMLENADPAGAGAGFARAVPNPEAFMHDVTRRLCRILYRAPEEPRKPSMILVRVYDFDGAANAGGTTINVSTRHLANYSGAALTEEITGVLVHEATHLYQYNDGPGGLIEGIADYVRIEAGHHSLNRRRAGGNWDDGYTTTGFFLSWLDDQYPDFGYKLNRTLTRDDNRGWSEEAFVELTGKDVDTLWREYQATL